jgi:hypothetical protein
MAALTLALLIPVFVIAVLLSRVIFEPRGWPACFLCASLAVGLAVGLTSLLFFTWLVLFRSSGLSAYIAMEIVLFVCLSSGTLLIRRRRVPIREPAPLAAWKPRTWLGYGCLAGFLCAAICFVIYSLKSPHGDLDAWAIWNNRARFLYRSGEDWRDTFRDPRIGWSHPDYPLLVPGSVARLWNYGGQETVLAPCLIGGLFTFATAGLLVSALSVLRSRSQGYIAGLLLFSSPFYLQLGTAQYADVPLSWFFLATLVLWCLERTPEGGQSLTVPLLTGLTAGLAAWTKNEGMLFFVAVLFVRLAADAWPADRLIRLRRTGMFLIGALPALLALSYFKFRIAPRNDLLTNMSQRPAVHLQIFEAQRFWVIFRETVAGMGRSVGIAVASMVICVACLGRKPGRIAVGYVGVGAVLALMVLGYGGVYLFASWEDLATHLRHSVDRLLAQLFPPILFFFGLSIATPEERRRPRLELN